MNNICKYEVCLNGNHKLKYTAGANKHTVFCARAVVIPATSHQCGDSILCGE